MAGHLHKQHGIIVKPEDKLSLESFSETLGIVNDPTKGPLPANHGPPVELVRVMDGFHCGVDGCQYAAGAKTTLSNHRLTNHPSFGNQQVLDVKVQALFSGVEKAYFIVNPALRSQSAAGAFHTLMTKVLPEIPPLQAQVPLQGREILPLHRVTGWWDILGDHILSRDTRQAVINLVSAPMGQEEQALSKLPSLCENYLFEAQTLAKNSPYVVRKKLVPEP
jgi:hypothetical protein